MTITKFNSFSSVCYSSIVYGGISIIAAIFLAIATLKSFEPHDAIFQIIIVICGIIVAAAFWRYLIKIKRMDG